MARSGRGLPTHVTMIARCSESRRRLQPVDDLARDCAIGMSGRPPGRNRRFHSHFDRLEFLGVASNLIKNLLRGLLLFGIRVVVFRQPWTRRPRRSPWDPMPPTLRPGSFSEPISKLEGVMPKVDKPPLEIRDTPGSHDEEMPDIGSPSRAARSPCSGPAPASGRARRPGPPDFRPIVGSGAGVGLGPQGGSSTAPPGIAGSRGRLRRRNGFPVGTGPTAGAVPTGQRPPPRVRRPLAGWGWLC